MLIFKSLSDFEHLILNSGHLRGLSLFPTNSKADNIFPYYPCWIFNIVESLTTYGIYRQNIISTWNLFAWKHFELLNQAENENFAETCL